MVNDVNPPFCSVRIGKSEPSSGSPVRQERRGEFYNFIKLI
ncbi:Uncharacterized protein dnm_014490 [Desulfonema magnum]|uniref:Uncharacterized protein n=1 Tax=Desulfonema magnum TaxID=45655 RepID=A0A975GLA5_9BACT|nr:Uncharacterized protein dnm_014490 [Desulfonema magnum]